MLAACPFPWPRGTPIRIHRMADALSRRGHEVHVVTYHLGDRTTPLSFAVHRIRDVPGYIDCRPGPTLGKLLRLDPMLIGKLEQLLDSLPFDVVHAHHYEGLLAALLSRARTPRPPVVYDAHTLLASELPFYRIGLPRGIKAVVGGWLDRSLPPRADHVIAVTDSIRDALLTGGRIDRSGITVISNGVESEFFATETVADARKSAEKRLIFAGNLAAYQGVDLLLQAFALIRRQVGVARLMLLTASDFTPYARLAETLGVRAAIELLNPEYAALPGHLQSADVLLNPRPACHGIPQKLLNYMAAGRPIVSFAGSAKIIEHEHSGLLVRDGDVDAFADAALRILSHPELGRRLGTNAQQLAAAHYGWHQVAAKVEALYEGVLARRRRDAGA